MWDCGPPVLVSCTLMKNCYSVFVVNLRVMFMRDDDVLRDELCFCRSRVVNLRVMFMRDDDVLRDELCFCRSRVSTAAAILCSICNAALPSLSGHSGQL